MAKRIYTKEEKVILVSSAIENISVISRELLMVSRNTPGKEIAERYRRAMRYQESIKVLSKFQIKIFCSHNFTVTQCTDEFDWVYCNKCFLESKMPCIDTLREITAYESIFADVR